MESLTIRARVPDRATMKALLHRSFVFLAGGTIGSHNKIPALTRPHDGRSQEEAWANHRHG